MPRDITDISKCSYAEGAAEDSRPSRGTARQVSAASAGLGRAWHDLGSGAARPRTDLCAGLPAPPPAPAPPWPSSAADPGTRGWRRGESSALCSLKESWRAAGQPCLCCVLHTRVPSSTPALPLPPSFPSSSSAPGAGLLQALLARHGGRDYFKSSEEESWQAGAGQGSWRCAARPGPGGSLRFPCAQCGFSRA